MTIKDIQTQADPVRKAAMIHCHFWHTAAWGKAREMCDKLTDEHDPIWPHKRFWDTVDELYMAGDCY